MAVYLGLALLSMERNHILKVTTEEQAEELSAWCMVHQRYADYQFFSLRNNRTVDMVKCLERRVMLNSVGLFQPMLFQTTKGPFYQFANSHQRLHWSDLGSRSCSLCMLATHSLWSANRR